MNRARLSGLILAVCAFFFLAAAALAEYDVGGKWIADDGGLVYVEQGGTGPGRFGITWTYDRDSIHYEGAGTLQNDILNGSFESSKTAGRLVSWRVAGNGKKLEGVLQTWSKQDPEKIESRRAFWRREK